MEDRTYRLLIVDSIMNLFRELQRSFRSLNMRADRSQAKTILVEGSFLSANKYGVHDHY
jgi:hypothetical protein